MKIIRRTAIVLAMIMCMSFTACGGDKPTDPNAPGDNTAVAAPVNPVRDPGRHYIEGGLHKVSVTPSSRAFVVNGSTDYEIIIGSRAAQLVEAVDFLTRHIQKATGANIAARYYDEGVTYSADSKYIAIGCNELFESAGLSMPSDNIGQTGYYIKSAGNSVFMQTIGVYGYQNAVIAFMRHVLGYERYSADIVTFSKDGSTLPDLDITEKPDFEFHIQGNATEYDSRYGMGFMEQDQIFISVEGRKWHNTFNFLPPDTYNNKEKKNTYHPDWYSTDGKQLCYTAHGSVTELAAMVDAVYEKVMMYADLNPDIANITFTQEDVPTPMCECKECQKATQDYGTISATIIKFCNAVSRKVQAELQRRADEAGTAKREFNILFFAYRHSEKPPVVKDANGVWQPKDETVRCDENVGVFIAPIEAFYNRSFYDDANSSAAANIDGWAACAQKLYMWLYETNYSYYFYPLNSYDTMAETYRFCFDRGAIFMMNEGQYNQPAVTHFSRLKEYFNGKAEFDVNVDFKKIVDDFFENYFKEAATPMRTSFDELQVQLRYIEAEYPADVNGGIYDYIEQERFWPKKMLDNWLALCDEATKAIEPYRKSDPEMYEILRDNIMLETFFPRYALIRLYPGYYDAVQLKEMQLSFKKDAQTFDIRRYQEGHSIDEIYAEWGV